MKPWEETWRNDDVIVVMPGRVEEIDARDRLATAAPEMARALLLWLPEGGHTLECGSSRTDEVSCSMECRASRQALRKAGVIL